MEFDAVCQKNNISSITCLNHYHRHLRPGQPQPLLALLQPLPRQLPPLPSAQQKESKNRANAAADKKSAADLRESSRMDVGGD